MIFRYLIVITLIFFYDFSLSQKADWELRKDEDGIKVYTRQKQNSKIIEFKAMTLIDRPVSTLIAVLKDVDSYDVWMADLKFSKKLKSINETEWYTYYIASVPWPLEERDILLHVKLISLKESTIISLDSEPDFIPKTEDQVRINDAKGKWIFTPEGENKTNVFYQFYADPEISVPIWISNLFIVKGPYDTLKDLKKIAAKAKYNN